MDPKLKAAMSKLVNIISDTYEEFQISQFIKLLSHVIIRAARAR